MDELKIKNKLNLASAFISEGKKLHALQVLNSIIDETDSIESNLMLAELLNEMGFEINAKKIFSNLLLQNPDNEEIKFYFAQFLITKKDWFGVVEIFSNDENVNPKSLFLVAYSYFMMEDFDLAKKYFISYSKFEKQNELKHEINLFLAKIEYELNNYNAALRYAKAAQFIYDDLWELNLILAKIYYELNMFAHALTGVQKALKHNTDDPAVLEYAAKIYFYLDDFKKAKKYFSKFIDSGVPVSAEVYTMLANTLMKFGELEKANSYFDLALLDDPTYNPAITGKYDLNKKVLS